MTAVPREQIGSSLASCAPSVAVALMLLASVLVSAGCASKERVTVRPPDQETPAAEVAVSTPGAAQTPEPETSSVPAPPPAEKPSDSEAGKTPERREPAPAAPPVPARREPTPPAANAPPPVAHPPGDSAKKSEPGAAKPAPVPALDLKSLEKRLRDTKAIGVFTKLSLKNQVDDLLDRFRAFHQGKGGAKLADLRQTYDLLLMKVLSLLQDSDPTLAHDIVGSREAIWGLLADPVKFATLS